MDYKEKYEMALEAIQVEDVIKTCFEFVWASKKNFDYDTSR